jgi:hypothetical protein
MPICKQKEYICDVKCYSTAQSKTFAERSAIKEHFAELGVLGLVWQVDTMVVNLVAVQLIIIIIAKFIDMELFLNIIHYCMYKADYKMHLFSNKINPFVLLGKIPAVRKKFEEQGTSLLGVTNKIWGDKRYGFSIMISGSAIVICLTFLIWGIVSSISSLFDLYFYIKPLHVVLYAINSYLTCHLTVFKGDKYLKYFKRFSKWSIKEKWLYSLLSFAFVIGSISLWIYSFRFLPKL